MRTHPFVERLYHAEFTAATGALTRINSEFLEADGPAASVGDYCEIEAQESPQPVLAEVVSVDSRSIRMVPLRHLPRLQLGASVRVSGQASAMPVGPNFAGRAIDGLARPIDGKAEIHPTGCQPRTGHSLQVLDRISPKEAIETGIRAIDGLLPLGKGQRIGIFAASGVGKTTLLDQLARQAKADRVVMCLVGERGREVEKLWRAARSSENSYTFTLVAATADESAGLRLRALEQALALAEFWRGQGEHVLFVVDSITRVAHALRELGLASGLPPTVRGLTPNVFSVLPSIVERCGAARSGGAITALMTVLSETDEMDDPVVELMKSVLDGHILLSRSFAERRHFPAIDISRSVSRIADDLLSPEELERLRLAHTHIATFEEARPMIESGLYREGANSDIDQAKALNPGLMAFLRQSVDQPCSRSETQRQLSLALHGGHDA